jgi:hypothetical protein
VPPTGDTSSSLGTVLVDETGRRARVLRRVGRLVSVLLLLWVGVLALGALGLEPLGGGVPGLRTSPGRAAAPPKLPARVQEAADAAPAPGPRRTGAAAPPAAARSAAPVVPRRAVARARARRSSARRPTLPSAARAPSGSPASAPPTEAATPATTSGKATSAPSRTGTTPSGNTVGGKSPATPPGQGKKTKTTP